MDPISLSTIAGAFVGMSAGIANMASAMAFVTMIVAPVVAILFPVIDQADDLFFYTTQEDGYSQGVLEGLAEYEAMVSERKLTDIEECRRAIKLARHRARVRAWIKPPMKAVPVKLERKPQPKPKHVRQRLQRRLLVDQEPSLEYTTQQKGMKKRFEYMERIRAQVTEFRCQLLDLNPIDTNEVLFESLGVKDPMDLPDEDEEMASVPDVTGDLVFLYFEGESDCMKCGCQMDADEFERFSFCAGCM